MAKRQLDNLLSVTLLVLVAIGLSYSDVLWRLDRWIYDVQLTLLAKPASSDIVIVQVDQKSLQKLGRWPWPRNVHAQLLDRLSAAQPRTIALDFIFSEADRQHPEFDADLSNALTRHKSVILPVIIERSGSTVVRAAPLPEFSQHSGLGHANIELDKDGIGRSIFLWLSLDGSQWPAMPLAIYAAHQPEILGSLQNLQSESASSDILQGTSRVLLPFFDPATDFTRVSYWDVLSGTLPHETFTNKYVLVGLTASGIERELPAPLAVGNRPLSGVDFIAAGLDGLLKQVIWQPLPGAWQLVLTVTLVGIALKVSTFYSPRWLGLVLSLIAAAVLVFSLLLLYTCQYWFAPAVTLAVVCLSYPLRTWRHFEKLIQSLFAERKRAYITLNAIVDGVIAIDKNGIVDFMNAAAQDIVGSKRPKHTSSHHIDDIFSVEINGAVHKISELIAQSTMNHGALQLSNSRLSVFDQHVMNANLTVSPLIGSRGALIGTVLTINDIGERIIMAKMLLQKTEEQTVMRELINRTEQVSLAKSQFLSQMSHELRTPLNAIIGFAQLMQIADPDHPLAETHRDSVDEILKAGFHLLGLINELLDLAKIESGKINLNISSVSLHELLDDCEALITPLLNNKELQLIVDNRLPHEVSLIADPKRAKQILLNFLSNAVKYNCPRGTITLSSAFVAINRVRISITDTGKGLADEEQTLLFQSFQRLGAENTDVEGTGIGLAITKQLAELMSGNVGVRSAPGKGSTFWVELLVATQ